MQATNPLISVIIPHLNQPDRLERCLLALAEQRKGAPPFEILVVDNGSDSPPAAICERFEGVRLETESIPGPGPARNRGVGLSDGPILAFIDADCVPGPGWVAAIFRRLDGDGPDRIIGGDVRILRADPSAPTVLEAYESVYAYRQREYIARQGFSGTGNLAVRRRDFEAIGPFAGISVSEDRDWGRRARKLGIPITYAPEMIVYHPARETFADLFAKWDRHIAHDFQDYVERPWGRIRWLGYAAAVAVSPLVEIARIARSDRLSDWRERRLALSGLVRIRSYRFGRMVSLLISGDPAASSASWNRTR